MGSLEYAHARLSARYGARPGEATWRRIEAIRGLPALLDAAHASPLREWVAGIGPESGAHAIEAALRARWRALVAEVSGWMPEAWEPAVQWAGALAELPVVQHLVRGGAAREWMRHDPLYRPLLGAAPEGPAAGHPLAPLRAAWSRPEGLWRAWREEWARRLPRGAMGEGRPLGELARLLASHRAAAVDALSGEASLARHELQGRLTRLFRRASLDPAAAFVFLALCALDLERLRGELTARALLPGLAPAA